MGILARGSGVYAIKNSINGKVYVGSTVDFSRRFRDHSRALCNGTHCNKHLQSAWQKHGPDAFEFQIVEQVSDVSALIEREQAWIDSMGADYNLCKKAGNTLGRRLSEDAKRRIAEAGRNRSEETLRRMSESARARAVCGSPDVVAAMTAVNMGNKYRQGILHTEETRLKMSLASKGKPKSPEHRAKLAAACTARNKARKKVA